MSEAERQRQMDFILNQQSQSAADTQPSRAEQEGRWKKADERWAETEEGIRALLALAEIHNQEIKEQSEQTAEDSRLIAESSRQIGARREAGRENGGRLSAFINTAERITGGRRDAGPRRG